ncbi:MAG: hypothetical protein AAF493_10100 [Pseudomonadota bacterium]
MEQNPFAFTNEIGELIALVSFGLPDTGFFNAYVFVPMVTRLSELLSVRLLQTLKNNCAFLTAISLRVRGVLLFSCCTLGFFAMNALFVSLKTSIVEELDYVEAHWSIPYAEPLHLYVATVAAAHLHLAWNNSDGTITRALCFYVQIGLLGGYYVALHRLLHEPFDLTDPATGLSGLLFTLWLLILNWDILRRLSVSLRNAAEPSSAKRESSPSQSSRQRSHQIARSDGFDAQRFLTKKKKRTNASPISSR